MIKTKDGYGKLIGTTYLGSSNLVLLSNGGNLEYSSSNKANTLVLRNSNLQVYASYFNSAISDESLTDIGSVYVRNTSDTFIRRISKSQFYSIIDKKFVTLDTVQTITGNKTFTAQINSSLSTTTYLEGNKGKTIINSTASAGSYVMLFKGNSTNGYFTHGVYLSRYLLQYTSKATVDAGTNSVTKSVTLLDESGNSSFPGNLVASGTVSGNILESRVATGTKPLNITSTTLVTNLNSDMLDSVHLAGFGGTAGVIRSWRRGSYTSANQYFGNGNVVTIDPIGTNCISANDTILSLGDSDNRNTLLLFAYDRDRVYYRRIMDTSSYGSWKLLAFITDNVASATKLLNPRYLWGLRFDGTKDVSGDMTNVGLINDSIRIEGGFDKAHIRGNGHGIVFGGGNSYAHCTYVFRPEWGSRGETLCNLKIQNASAATSNPSYTTTHEFVSDGTAYHRARVRVARTDGEGSGIYTNTIRSSDWFRSEGNTGWYSEAWGGGWYMSDSSYIRTYNNKAVVALRYDADQGLSGSVWNNGQAAYSVRIHNNENQTPLLLAYRNSTADTGENRLFALELSNSGKQLAFGMGGKAVMSLSNRGGVECSSVTTNYDNSGLDEYSIYYSPFWQNKNVINYSKYRYILGWEDSCPQGWHTGYGIGTYRTSENDWGSMLFEVCNYEGSKSRLTQMEIRGRDNTLWFSGDIAASNFIGNLQGNADSADKLVPHYDGGVLTNPQKYFNGLTGVKVAMTGVGGMGSHWTDTLWINGYGGGDVKGMCALHFSRQNGPRFAISHLNFDSSSYGTPYEVWTTYNFNPNGSSSHPIVLASGYITISTGTFSGCKNSKVSISVGRVEASYRITVSNSVVTSAVVQQRSSKKVAGNSYNDITGRSDGAYWFSTYVINTNTVGVRYFCLANNDNDAWQSRSYAWSNGEILSISVTIFGYCT